MQITEAAFLASWNIAWLPHPTRDIQTQQNPWTEDNGRDFLLQTGLAICCGARPHDQGAPVSVGQLTPAATSHNSSGNNNKSPATTASTNVVAMADAADISSPSALRLRRSEESQLKELIHDLLREKKRQFDQQQQQQQQEQQQLSFPGLTPKEFTTALLPGNFWMSSGPLPAVAISCAWRAAFHVEPLDLLTQLQNEFLSQLQDNTSEEKSSDATIHALYEAVLEDRSLAATHLKGMISRKLTLDRFSVRELTFLWHLLSGPRANAQKWFRRVQKEQQQQSLQDQCSATPALRNPSGSAAAAAVAVSTAAGTPTITTAAVSSSSPATMTNNNNSNTTSIFMSHPLLPPVSGAFIANCPAIVCTSRRESVLFELRGVYYSMLEQFGIGKERKSGDAAALLLAGLLDQDGNAVATLKEPNAAAATATSSSTPASGSDNKRQQQQQQQQQSAKSGRASRQLTFEEPEAPPTSKTTKAEKQPVGKKAVAVVAAGTRRQRVVTVHDDESSDEEGDSDAAHIKPPANKAAAAAAARKQKQEEQQKQRENRLQAEKEEEKLRQERKDKAAQVAVKKAAQASAVCELQGTSLLGVAPLRGLLPAQQQQQHPPQGRKSGVVLFVADDGAAAASSSALPDMEISLNQSSSSTNENKANTKKKQSAAENNHNNKVTIVMSTVNSADVVPRGDGVAWGCGLLTTSSSNNRNATPPAFQEYYRACFCRMRDAGLKMDDASYLTEKFA